MATPSPRADAPFPLVLAWHHRERSTGTLIAVCPPFRKKVYLQGGAVVFAASDDRNDRLGEMLVRRGVLRVADFLEASAQLKPGTRFGTLLVERGLLSAPQLVWAVKEQVKEIVFSLFPLRAQDCEFVPGAAAGDEIITLNINTPELLKLGVDRFDRIPPALEIFDVPELPLRLRGAAETVAVQLKLDDRQARLLGALAAPRTLAETLAATGGGQDFATLKLLWVLWALDLLEVGAAEPGPEDLGITASDLSGF